MQKFTLNRRTFSRTAGLAIAAATADVPAATGAQDATPATTPASGGLAGMLVLAPEEATWLDDAEWLGDPKSLTITYADIAAQLEVTGVTSPETVDDAAHPLWLAATRSLALPVNPLQYHESWRRDYGFDLFQTDETLELSLGQYNLTLLRGRFDNDAIRATLTANGYRPVDVDGHEVFTLREDYHHDPTSDFAYKLAAMNHVALLEDGTIACSSVQAAAAAVPDVAAGRAPSLMGVPGIAAIAEHAPADLVSATMMGGTTLAAGTSPALRDGDPNATPAFEWPTPDGSPAGELSPVEMALIGSTAGGPLIGEDIETPPAVPDARAVAMMLMQSPAAAQEAVPVVEARLATGEAPTTGWAYSDLFAVWDVQAVPSTPVLVIELSLAPETRPHVLFDMLMRGDLGFLAW